MDTLSKLLARVPFNSSPNVLRFALLFLTSLTLTLIMSPLTWELLAPVNYHKGEIAKYSVRASRDYLVEDVLTSESKRAEAVAAVHSVFAINDAEETSVKFRMHSLFSTIDTDATVKPPYRILELSKEHRANLERQFGLDLVGEEWDVVMNPSLWPELEQAAVTVAQPILDKGIIANKAPLIEALAGGMAVVRSKSKNSEIPLISTNSIYDATEALATARIGCPTEGFGNGPVFDTVVKKLVYAFLQPNLIYDAQETDRRIQSAANSVRPIYTRIPRGQVVVQAGDTINAAQEAKLKQMHEALHPLEVIRTAFATFLLTAIFIAISFRFVTTFWPSASISVKDLVLLAMSLVGSFVLVKLHSILSLSLSYSFPALDADSFILATPLATWCSKTVCSRKLSLVFRN